MLTERLVLRLRVLEPGETRGMRLSHPFHRVDGIVWGRSVSFGESAGDEPSYLSNLTAHCGLIIAVGSFFAGGTKSLMVKRLLRSGYSKEDTLDLIIVSKKLEKVLFGSDLKPWRIYQTIRLQLLLVSDVFSPTTVLRNFFLSNNRPRLSQHCQHL